MGGFLVLAGSAGVAIGLVAALRGSLPRFKLTSRAHAAVLIAAGFLAIMAGAALAEPPADPDPQATFSDAPPPLPPPPSPAPDLVLVPIVEDSHEPSPGAPSTSVSRARQPAATRPPAAPRGAAAPSAGCDASYPDFCIPPPPPDLDCSDLIARNFTVLPPDPHRFDADDDGRGCELDGAPGASATNPMPQPQPQPAPQPPAGPPAAPVPPAPPVSPAGPAPPPAPPQVPPPADCHPSYPGVCIPPPPPDLDCPDVPHNNFAVVGSDPHRFDADGDGIGCEA